jgi:hypothetical protein
MPSALPFGFSTSATRENERFLMLMTASSGSRTVPGPSLALLPDPYHSGGRYEKTRHIAGFFFSYGTSPSCPSLSFPTRAAPLSAAAACG